MYDGTQFLYIGVTVLKHLEIFYKMHFCTNFNIENFNMHHYVEFLQIGSQV